MLSALLYISVFFLIQFMTLFLIPQIYPQVMDCPSEGLKTAKPFALGFLYFPSIVHFSALYRFEIK